MKWTNKGHELDKYAKKLLWDFKNKKEKIYVFGAGLIGREIRGIIKKTGCFAGFIDNDKEKQNDSTSGEIVISLQEYLDRGKTGLIVIAADEKNIPTITKQLIRAGLGKRRDYYVYEEFMRDIFPILSVYSNNQLYVEVAQICLTERCSLKCKKCAHGCYAVGSQSQDMSVEMAKKSADCFFEYVDIIKDFVLIGGEPFLYQNLEEIIEYIGKKYRTKMVKFTITTNGTIVSGQSLLEKCKKYDVTICLSDYSAINQCLKPKYERLQKVLQKNSVLYAISDKEKQWMDYGFETVDRDWKKEELKVVFDKCKTPCREIRGNKYYYCVMARSVSENLGFGLGQDDYLDLDTLDKNDKKILLEFELGYSEKGYLDMCNHCNGADARNYPIPAAEQM